MVDRSTQQLFGVIQIAALLRKDKADVSRAAARGDYGKPAVRKGGTFKRYALAGIEKAAGKKFTPEQIALAQATHDHQPARPALLLDFATALLALNNLQWIEHLNALGITDFKPLPASNLRGSKS